MLSKAGRSTGELRLRRKDGSEFHAVLESVSEESGSISLAVIDVSDRKNAETAVRRQADLLNLTHDTIIVRNMEDAVIFWNRGAEDAYGWQSREAVGQGIAHAAQNQVSRTVRGNHGRITQDGFLERRACSYQAGRVRDRGVEPLGASAE